MAFSGATWVAQRSTNGLQGRRSGFDPQVWKIPWRRKWQPIPVFLPGKYGQRSLAGYGVAKGQTRPSAHSHTHCRDGGHVSGCQVRSRRKSTTIFPGGGDNFIPVVTAGLHTFNSLHEPGEFHCVEIVPPQTRRKEMRLGLLYFKWITNKDLLYSTGNSDQCYVAAWMWQEFGGEWVYRAESFTVTWSYHNIVNWLYSNKK